jgi:O-antigen ligase
VVTVLRVFPADEWRTFRVLVFGLGCVLSLLAITGVLDATMFVKPSTIKYIVTVVGAALLVLLPTIRAPLRPLVGLAILVAPINFVTTFSGLGVTPLLAIDLVALLVALPRHTIGSSSLGFASVLFAALLVPALAQSRGVGSWVLWLALTLVTGWLTYLVACEPGGPRFVIVMLALTGLIQGALAVWEFRSGHQLNLYSLSGTTATSGNYYFKFGSLTRSSGTLPDPIGLGQVLALCIPMFVALAAAMRRPVAALAVLGGLVVAALGLALSLSRESMVGALAGLILALLLLPGRSRLRGWVSVGGMLVVVAVLALSFGGRQLSTRVKSILNPTANHLRTAQGDVARQRIWQGALRVSEHHPMGVGFGRITEYLPKYGLPTAASAHAHDTYLQFLAEGGVFGLLALLVVVVAAVRDLARGFASERLWVAGSAGGLLATLIVWLTDVEVRYVQVSAVVAVLLGLIAALAARRGRSQEGAA